MPWKDDITVLNAGGNSGDWVGSGFDAPQDNNNASTFPIYLEGVAALFWALKKGVTDGYVYTSTITGTPSMAGRVMVGFINFPFADLGNIPITSLRMRMSSSTGFTSNYAEWDARSQILSPENIPISGHTPVMGYSEGADTVSGTPNYGTIESVGWVATTGQGADGKQGGFDWFFVISYVGAHSATYNGTYFDGLYNEYYDNNGGGLPGQTNRPIAVLSKAGEFYQSNISFAIGDSGASALTSVIESDKTIFFNNLHPNQSLGYIGVDSGVNEVRLELDGMTHLWNDQSASCDIFTDPQNFDQFKINGSSFVNGGVPRFRSWISDALTYVTGCSFTACQEIPLTDILFNNNSISGAVSGALIDTTLTARRSGNTYSGCTDAVRIVGTGPDQTVTLDDNFIGNTTDIFFDAPSGTLTVYAGPNSTSKPTTWRVPGGSTATVNIVGDVRTFSFDVVPAITGYEWRLYDKSAVSGTIGTELDGEESATVSSQSYQYTYSVDDPVVLQVFAAGYEEFLQEYTLIDADQNVTVNLETETNL